MYAKAAARAYAWLAGARAGCFLVILVRGAGRWQAQSSAAKRRVAPRGVLSDGRFPFERVPFP